MWCLPHVVCIQESSIYLYWNLTIIIESCVAFQVEPTKYYEQILQPKFPTTAQISIQGISSTRQGTLLPVSQLVLNSFRIVLYRCSARRRVFGWIIFRALLQRASWNMGQDEIYIDHSRPKKIPMMHTQYLKRLHDWLFRNLMQLRYLAGFTVRRC